MEEIRTTEALDREILEDARKKADRILKTVEQSAQAAEDEWKERIEADLNALRANYERKAAERRTELKARLPLEKRRLRAERSNSLLSKAVRDYMGALDRTSALALLGRELDRRINVIQSRKIRIESSGLTEAEIKALIHNRIAEADWTIEKIKPDPGKLPSLFIECGDCRIRIGLGEFADELLRENREELARALLGEEAVND